LNLLSQATGAQVTSEEEWISELGITPIWRPPVKPMIVIAPHPDDETLGAGGLIAGHRRAGLPVIGIAVTDGEGAYTDEEDLGTIRRNEQERAFAVLRVEPSRVIRLKFPDRYVSDYEDRLFDFLKTVVDEETILVAPWSRDPHSDHEACGRVAERIYAGRGALLVSYLFWAWHWRAPEEVLRQPICRFELDSQLQQAKQAALAEHHSQLMRAQGDPILTPHLLLPARRSFETFIVHEQ